MQQYQQIIEEAWEDRASLQPGTTPAKVGEAVGLILNELDEGRLRVAEKINGEWVQKLTIYYNCVGALFIPDTPSMPVPDVTVNTRRGVYVSYEPAQNGQ